MYHMTEFIDTRWQASGRYFKVKPCSYGIISPDCQYTVWIIRWDIGAQSRSQDKFLPWSSQITVIRGNTNLLICAACLCAMKLWFALTDRLRLPWVWFSIRKCLEVASSLRSISHLQQCDRVHERLRLRLWVPPTYHTAFSPGKCFYMEMYTMWKG